MADIQRYQVLAHHLAHGETLRDAARLASVPERSAQRASKNPKFRRLVKRCRSRQWRALSGKLMAACETAVAALLRMATDDAAPATAKVSAARGIIEAALRFKESADFERRLSELEGRMEGHAAVK